MGDYVIDVSSGCRNGRPEADLMFYDTRGTWRSRSFDLIFPFSLCLGPCLYSIARGLSLNPPFCTHEASCFCSTAKCEDIGSYPYIYLRIRKRHLFAHTFHCQYFCFSIYGMNTIFTLGLSDHRVSFYTMPKPMIIVTLIKHDTNF